jgi:hypothetical protein
MPAAPGAAFEQTKRLRMKLFACQSCGQALYFENTACHSCGRPLGFMPEDGVLSALEADDGRYRALAEPKRRYRACANVAYGSCNWMIRVDDSNIFCFACRHNRTIPNLSDPGNLARWRKIEIAKHRLFYTLLNLHLPLATKAEDDAGLAFDFLSDPAEPSPDAAAVMTGHLNGLITINLAEADDAERERRRGNMNEPYRTLLGHFRHEIGHYYWDRLVRHGAAIEDFRALFGDERQDYGAALQAHHHSGPPPDWPERYISAYASAHPWEDFAETWAHYFHMVDTLETARAFGLNLHPGDAGRANLSAAIDFDPHVADIDRLIDAWLPLTFAINSINRSMGQPDLYPFVLVPAVIVKLAFIRRCIHRADGAAEGALRAVAAGLKRNIGAPNQDRRC